MGLQPWAKMSQLLLHNTLKFCNTKLFINVVTIVQEQQFLHGRQVGMIMVVVDVSSIFSMRVSRSAGSRHARSFRLVVKLAFLGNFG